MKKKKLKKIINKQIKAYEKDIKRNNRKEKLLNLRLGKNYKLLSKIEALEELREKIK